MELFRMLVLFFLFSLYATRIYAGEDDKGFLAMKEHIKDCAVDCTNLACAHKETKIPDMYYKGKYREVYCTYHCISEINAQKYGLSTKFRYFTNFNGEYLGCKKGAKTKEELILLKRDKYHASYNSLEEAFRNNAHVSLDTLRSPAINSVRAKNVDNKLQEWTDQRWIELCCCTDLKYPTDVINLIGQEIGKVRIYTDYRGDTGYRPIYFYSFFDLGYSLNRIAGGEKRWLFSIIEATRLQKELVYFVEREKQTPKRQRSIQTSVDYGKFIFFSIDQPLTVTELHSGIDFHNNGGTRIVIQGEYEEGTIFKQKKYALLNIPHEEEHGVCNHCNECVPAGFIRRTGFKKYTIEDVEKNHANMHKGLVGPRTSNNPLDCYCSQLITGQSGQIKKQLRVALKRSELRTACLYKNEAASTPGVSIYNNPYSEFVIYKEGKPVILEGYMRHYYSSGRKVYHAIHTDDVLHDAKMQALAQHYAQSWKRAPIYEANGYRSEYIYCYEKDPSDVFALEYPYGGCDSWKGDSSQSGHREFYEQNKDINLLDCGVEQFRAYRLWMLPMYGYHWSMVINPEYSQKTFDLYMVYTDWPYTITAHTDWNSFTLEHEESDFTVFFKIDYDRYNEGPYVKINIGKRTISTDEKKSSLTLTYALKDKKESACFEQEQQRQDQEMQTKKLAEENDSFAQDRQRKGFGPQASSATSDGPGNQPLTRPDEKADPSALSYATFYRKFNINILHYMQRGSQIFAFFKKPRLVISLGNGTFGKGIICGFTLGLGVGMASMLWYLKGHQFAASKPVCATG